MGLWLAALSGLIAGGALLAGFGSGVVLHIPKRVVAAIMALGAGVLISTLAYELVEEAADDGGLVPTVRIPRRRHHLHRGGLAGLPPSAGRATAAIGEHRRLPVGAQPWAAASVIAIGALIDGIPESIVMGLSVLQGGLSIPIVAAIAISNIPEGLASTAQLKRSGMSGWWIARLWLGIAPMTVVASVVGFAAFQSASPDLIAVITTIAAGGLLAMVCNTMIPEAFDEQHALTGLWATIGFLFAFVLHELA